MTWAAALAATSIALTIAIAPVRVTRPPCLPLRPLCALGLLTIGALRLMTSVLDADGLKKAETVVSIMTISALVPAAKEIHRKQASAPKKDWSERRRLQNTSKKSSGSIRKE